MNRLLLLLLISCLFCSTSFSQETRIDSLWDQWNNEKLIDTLRLEALRSIIKEKRYYTKDLDSTLLLCEKLRELAEKGEHLKWEYYAYVYQAAAYYYHGNYEQALVYHTKKLGIKETLKDIKGIAVASQDIAVTYKQLGKLPEALSYALKSFELRKTYSNGEGLSKSLQLISSIYYNQGNFNKALEYAKNAYISSEKANYRLGMAGASVNMANTYMDLKQFDEAEANLLKAVALYEELGHQRHLATSIDNLGNLFFERKNYEQALHYQQKALNIRQTLTDTYGLALSFNNLGSTYAKLDQISLSISFCKKAFDLANEIQNLRLIYAACECLEQGYAGIGDIENAYTYYKLFVLTKDSLDGVEKSRQIEEIESRYQLKEKEAQISQQRADIAEAQNDRFQTIIFSLGIIFGLATLFFWLRNRLLRRNQEAELLAERERTEAEKLRELDQIKSNFFANISHEFRTPLTLIMGPLEQMLSGTLEGNMNKYQKMMQRSGKRLQALIDQLLDLSKLESGNLQLHLHQGDLSHFLATVAHGFQSIADRKLIDYQITNLEWQVEANFDKDVLEKVLTNLISNAFKFTSEEGMISVVYALQNEILHITISDSGIGIPKEDLANIFERFYSKGNHSDLQGSSGIGLALTKELVDLYQGTISVESEEGKGSTFHVTLPIDNLHIGQLYSSISEKKTLAPIIPIQKAQESSTNGKTFKDLPMLLIVEDNEDVRTYLKDQLHTSYQIVEALHGEMGLNMAKKLTPDLVISDVMMPEMDGNQLCSFLKTDPRTSHIPVILLTAKATHSAKLEGLETGADAYVTKPFDPNELHIRVRKLIEQRKELRKKFSSDFHFAPAEVTVTSVDAEFLEKIRRIIEENLDDETFSVEELGREIAMSRSNLFRKLKALTDRSPNQVIREMRLIRAKELLEKGAGNATEVAFMVGFNSATYFSTCFKEHFGLRPLEVM